MHNGIIMTASGTDDVARTNTKVRVYIDYLYTVLPDIYERQQRSIRCNCP